MRGARIIMFIRLTCLEFGAECVQEVYLEFDPLECNSSSAHAKNELRFAIFTVSKES